MNDTRRTVALTRLALCVSLLLCVAILGGAQLLAAQATNAPTTRVRPTNAQRKTAAANAARRRAANPTAFQRHTNAIVGQPGGAALTADQLYFSGTYSNYAFSPLPNPADPACALLNNLCGIRKFVDALPLLNTPNILGQMIPVAVADKVTFPGSDYYEISLRNYTEKMHSDLPPTELRGYVQTNVTPAMANHYLGPLIIAQSDRPVRIKFTNELPSVTISGALGGNLRIPVDTSLMGSGLGFSLGASPYLQNRATIHLHGGNTPWISDGTPHQWTIPSTDWNNTLYQRGVSAKFVPDMFFDAATGAVIPKCDPLNSAQTGCTGGLPSQLPVGKTLTNDPGNGSLTFYYTNQQSARLMFYHDHSYGTTRLNVYAGEAAGYLLQDKFEADMVNGDNAAGSGVFAAAGILTPTPVIPAAQIPLVIQEKTFVPQNPATAPVYSVALLASGAGYTNPKVVISGGGCTTAPTASATFGEVTDNFGNVTTGAITGITLVTAGLGCSSYPVVTITDGTTAFPGPGTGATAFASLATLKQQDPTWDAALWGSYGNLWYPHVYMPNEWPANPDGSELNPMGRWDYGPWVFPVADPATLIGRGPIFCGGADPTMMCPGAPTNLTGGAAPANRPAAGLNLPFQGAGSIASMTPEAFLDTPIVNGTPYPVLTIDPKPYRLRILSAANDRSFNLSWFLACGNTLWYAPTTGAVCPTPLTGMATDTEVGMVPAVPTGGFPSRWPTDGRPGGVPDPKAAGPSWIAIGNEGGFLPAPVTILPTPISYDTNPGSATFGNTTIHGLDLMPAERADVIVDFSKYAGMTLILYNDGPAPYPGFDSRYDFYTADPDQTGIGGAPSTLAGFGPNTRTIMQVHVNNVPTTAYVSTNLAPVLAAAFNLSQPKPVVPEPVYNAVYKPVPAFTNNFGKFNAAGMTFTPINGVGPITLSFNQKSINEQFEPNFGRLNATIGTGPTLAYVDPPTEVICDGSSMQCQRAGTAADGSQIWQVVHYGVDSHAMHFHLYDVEVLNRYGFDGTPRPADPLETGWKDTVRMNPREVTYVALRPMAQQNLPFPVPDSSRLTDVTEPAMQVDPEISAIGPLGTQVSQANVELPLGWEYVWHCHILGHEEEDMMREEVFQVPPEAPLAFTVQAAGSGDILTFTDASVSATGFSVQRADSTAFTPGLVTTFPDLSAKSLVNGKMTWTDATAVGGKVYAYRVQSFKPDVNLLASYLQKLTSAWVTASTTLVPTVTPVLAPASGFTFTGTTQTFSWTAATGATAYSLWVGTTAGSSNLFNKVTASTSMTVNVLPVNGGPVYVRLNWFVGGTWLYADYTYTGLNSATAMVSPTAGLGTILPAGTATFTWSVAPSATQYALWVGTTAGSSNLFNKVTAGTSLTVDTLPLTGGGTVYVRLNWFVGGTWLYVDYVYTGFNSATAMVSPTAGLGTILPAGTATFTWSATPSATQYALWVGTTAGSSNLFNKVTAGTSLTVNALPVSGGTVYVRLNWFVGGTWLSANYVYTGFNSVTAMVSPTAGLDTILPAGTATFIWSAAPSATQYALWVGTTAGSSNLFNKVTAGTSLTVNTLPLTGGGTVYVRLNWFVGGVWKSVDYTYTAFD